MNKCTREDHEAVQLSLASGRDAAWRAGQCPGASGRGFDVKVTSKQNLKKFYNNRRKWSLILF